MCVHIQYVNKNAQGTITSVGDGVGWPFARRALADADQGYYVIAEVLDLDSAVQRWASTSHRRRPCAAHQSISELLNTARTPPASRSPATLDRSSQHWNHTTKQRPSFCLL
jgi:hypothetical protein